MRRIFKDMLQRLSYYCPMPIYSSDNFDMGQFLIYVFILDNGTFLAYILFHPLLLEKMF